MAEDAHPEHWRDYTNLQHVKHELIREYLNGWFPKLGLWSGRVDYFDTHAGRGKYTSGEAGSPVVAIDTLLRHSFRDRILEKSQVHFFFIEDDAKNVEALRGEVARKPCESWKRSASRIRLRRSVQFQSAGEYHSSTSISGSGGSVRECNVARNGYGDSSS